MQARPLSPAERDAYTRSGYLTYGPILMDDELADLRGRVDEVIAHLPAGQRPEGIEGPHTTDPYFLTMASHPRLLDVVEQVLGPNIAIFGTTLIAKPGGDGKPVPWHQDTAFWPLDPMRVATLWLAVDDSTRENGCMRVIPGSHRRGAAAHAHVDTQTYVLGLQAQGVDETLAVDIELPAGACSLHDPGLLHGSLPNTSPRRRCGFVLHYMAAEARLDRSRKGWADFPLYLVRGSDTQGVNRYRNVA